MKKKIWIPVVIIVIVLAILVIPIPTGVYKDGGTREYTALTYKIVDWNRLSGETTYNKTNIYLFPNNFKSIDTLWNNEDDKSEPNCIEYSEVWLDKTAIEKYDHDVFDNITITKIYSNCFFATSALSSSYELKLNGTLSAEWCVGDQITCTCANIYIDEENERVEADMLTVAGGDWQGALDAKPVIYLYPEEETEVSVTLTLDGRLTCTYPAYNTGWTVTARPDGTLTDASGRTYNYLYWEGESYAQYDLSEGFCVKGEDTAAFLEDALDKLGLTRREANEFIVYWLPLMEQNPYNIISFQTDTYTESAKLDVSPAPDTMIRVFMAWQASAALVDLPGQELSAPERVGFTVVEWGGSEIK